MTLANPSMHEAWEVFEWHHECGIGYYPTIDPRTNEAHYDFEDHQDAMHFRLKFGGTPLVTDN